ncbi:hypothetical protein D3C76_704820 [compost metagenome]
MTFQVQADGVRTRPGPERRPYRSKQHVVDLRTKHGRDLLQQRPRILRVQYRLVPFRTGHRVGQNLSVQGQFTLRRECLRAPELRLGGCPVTAGLIAHSVSPLPPRRRFLG